MTATIAEKLGSGELQLGDTGRHQRQYIILDETSETAAMTILGDTAPSTFGDLVLQSLRVTPADDSSDKWIGEAEYADSEDVTPAEGSTTFSFNTSGGSMHITQSISTSNSYAPAGKTAPDYKGAINATDEGSVDGVDILNPIYRWSEMHVVPDSKVTNIYKGRLFHLTAKTNNAPFQGFAIGECLFEGATGSKRGDGAWEITYNFASSPNVSGKTIGAITGVNKLGWEYLWVLYSDVADAGKPAKQPRAVYIEQVYESGNFADLIP